MTTSFRIPPASDRVASPAWPVGLYRCTLDHLEQEPENRFSDLARIRWEFAVTRVISTTDRARVRELLAEDARIMGWNNLTMARKSTMRAWVEALMGHTLAEGETPDDPHVLIGREVNVNIVQHTKDDGTLTTKIGALQPITDDDDEPMPTPPPRRTGPGDRVMQSAEGLTAPTRRREPEPAPVYDQHGNEIGDDPFDDPPLTAPARRRPSADPTGF